MPSPGGKVPPKGADEERRSVPNLFAVREKGTLGKVVPFEWTALRMVRCRHSSSTASRSPFPPGQCHQLKEPGPDLPVIAGSSAHWRGNPFPLQRHDFLHVTKEKTDCHVASLLAMTVVDGTLALKLMTLPPGGRYCAAGISIFQNHPRRGYHILYLISDISYLHAYLHAGAWSKVCLRNLF